MAKAIALRVMHSLVSLLAVLIFVFCLVRVSGDPLDYLLEPGASQSQKDALEHLLALDKSLPEQFIAYIGQLAHGNLGISFVYRVPVTELLADRAPATLSLGLAALVLIVVLGVPLGIYAARWRGSTFDRFVRAGAAVSQSVPNFWIGFILILVFGIWLKALPTGGYGSFNQIILPAFTLAIVAIAGLIRLLRSSMIEELGKDYITFHRIKGMPERRILWKYGLRNAGLTTLGYLGIVVASTFTGSILVETIFNWPGLGLLFVTGIENRDFGVVQGGMIVYACAYLLVNLAVDIGYLVLNPRLR
jgi:peptide/nickel transport system permease protein